MGGLERLPRITSGIGIELSLTAHQGENWTSQSVHLDEETFFLDTAESIYDPAIGSDYSSWRAFEVDAWGNRSDTDYLSLVAWFEGFAMRLADPEIRLEIDNFGDALDLEWEEETPLPDLWNELETEFP